MESTLAKVILFGFHSIGFYELTARLYQMEATAIVEVVAGSPHEFIFDENIVVRSGSPLQMNQYW